MTLLRLALGGLPRLLVGIMHDAVAATADMTIVAEFATRSDLIAAAANVEADVWVVSLDSPTAEPALTEHMNRQPGLRILGVTPRHSLLFLYELRPHRTALGNVSPRALLGEIRRACTAAHTHRLCVEGG